MENSFTDEAEIKEENGSSKTAEETEEEKLLKEMETLTRKIKKFQEKFEGKVELEFKGYAEMSDQLATQLPDGTIEIQDEMSSELKKVIY